MTTLQTTSEQSTSPAAWRVPFVRPDVPTLEDLEPALQRIFASGMLTKGPELLRLEADVKALTGAVDAVAVSSCTVGLALGLRALRELHSGHAKRQEVVLPSFTFLAAPAAVVWAGYTPVFVDVDPQTWTVSPAAVEAAVGPRTAAVVACHTFGCPCDMAALAAISERLEIPLMVDAAHGFGTSLSGKQVGREGFAQVFSMSPTKLVVAGEGGVVTTSSEPFAALLRELREYGNDGAYGCAIPGLNGRLPEVSAALGRASLARLPEVAERRNAAADAYLDVLGGTPGLGFQQIPSGAASSWKDFSLTIDAAVFGTDRDAVRRHLARHGIDTRAYYSPACHRMEAFAPHHPTGRPLPITDRLAATSLSLPMGGHVTPTVARAVANDLLGARPAGSSSR